MGVRVLMTMAFTTMFAMSAAAALLPVILRNGQAHVTSSALEREVGIVIKKLPGRAEFVACGAEGCAALKSVLTEGDTLLVPVDGLNAALNLSSKFDEGRLHVALVPAPREAPGSTGLARVGSIAPNLRLTQLDGTSISLDELRGQRVLINSWASW